MAVIVEIECIFQDSLTFMKLFLHKKHAECTVSVTQLAALVVSIIFKYMHVIGQSRGVQLGV